MSLSWAEGLGLRGCEGRGSKRYPFGGGLLTVFESAHVYSIYTMYNERSKRFSRAANEYVI